MDDSQELRQVIDKKWDYLRIRHRLSELSGHGCMAYTTDQHIDLIMAKLSDQKEEISRLRCQIKKVKDATNDPDER